jgi:hypothetical protein
MADWQYLKSGSQNGCIESLASVGKSYALLLITVSVVFEQLRDLASCD